MREGEKMSAKVRAKGTAAAAGASASVQEKKIHKNYFLAVLCFARIGHLNQKTHTYRMDKKRNSIFLSFYFYSYSLLVLHHNFTFSITSTATAVAANVSSYYPKEERGNSYKSNAVQMQKHLNQLFALKSIL